MKLALIGDIHANLPALEAVLKEVEAEGCSRVFDVGDAVGYGPFPNEVTRLLRDQKVNSIQGNYDRWVCRFDEKPDKAHKLREKDPLKFLSIKWTRGNLTPKNLEYLRSLPELQEHILGGMRLMLVHGSVGSRKEGLRMDTPDERLLELSEQTTADIVVSGHSHDPFIRRVNSTWFVNTGSVGRANDGDYRATYVLAEIAHRKFQAEIRRVEYDLDRLIIAIRQAGLPQTIAEMFKQGVHHREIVAASQSSPASTAQ